MASDGHRLAENPDDLLSCRFHVFQSGDFRQGDDKLVTAKPRNRIPAATKGSLPAQDARRKTTTRPYSGSFVRHGRGAVINNRLKLIFDRMAAQSWRNHQLLGIEQQKVGAASFFPVAVIADDNDALAAVDHGGAHPFGVLEAWQAGHVDTACLCARMTAPEPELEVNLLDWRRGR